MSVTSYSSALGLYGLSPRAESAYVFSCREHAQSAPHADLVLYHASSSYVLPASSYTYSTPQDPQPSVWRHNNSIIHNDSDYYPSAPPSPAPVPIPFRNVDRHPPAFLPASQNFYSRASHHVSPSLSPPYTPYHSPPPSGSSRPTALPIESLVQHSFIYRSPEDSHPPSRAISRSESASGAPNEDVKPALSATALEARPTGLYIEATRRAEETRDVFKLSLAPAEAKVERSRVKKASLAGDLDSPRRRHFCPLCDCRGFARPSALKIHIVSPASPHVSARGLVANHLHHVSQLSHTKEKRECPCCSSQERPSTRLPPSSASTSLLTGFTRSLFLLAMLSSSSLVFSPCLRRLHSPFRRPIEPSASQEASWSFFSRSIRV